MRSFLIQVTSPTLGELILSRITSGGTACLTWESFEPVEDEESLGWLNVTQSVWRNTVGDPKTAKSKAPGPIFANSVGDPLDLNACYQREMKDVLKRASISWHGWHGFRRGLASNLNHLGVDDSVIQRILRHPR